MSDAPGNPEEVLDAVFDFAENLIAQQRVFAKQMLRAAGSGRDAIDDLTAQAQTGPTAVPDAGERGPDATSGTAPQP